MRSYVINVHTSDGKHRHEIGQEARDQVLHEIARQMERGDRGVISLGDHDKDEGRVFIPVRHVRLITVDRRDI